MYTQTISSVVSMMMCVVTNSIFVVALLFISFLRCSSSCAMII